MLYGVCGLALITVGFPLFSAQVYGNTNGGLVTEGYLGNRLEVA